MSNLNLMEEKNDNTVDGTIPLQRKWLKAKENLIEQNCTKTADDTETDRFSIVSYNILADSYTPEHFFPYCPRDYWKDVQRFPQLMRELEHHEPNIICMQEVGGDFYKNHLEPALHDKGYRGSYHETVDPVGLATFYQESCFDLIEEKKVDLTQVFQEEVEKRNMKEEETISLRLRMLLFSRLRCRKSKKILCLGNVHIMFLGYKRLDVAAIEAALAIRLVTKLAGGAPHILCGDFNQEPHMPGYQLLQNGCLAEEDKEVLRGYPLNGDNNGEKKNYLVDLLPDVFSHESKHLKSAYKTIAGHEVPFSNHEDMNGTMKFPTVSVNDTQDVPDLHISPEGEVAPKAKKKKTDQLCRMYQTKPENYGKEVFISALDYFWYDSSGLKCTGVLEMIDESKIEQFHSAPNIVFPSDHLLMKAEFKFFR